MLCSVQLSHDRLYTEVVRGMINTCSPRTHSLPQTGNTNTHWLGRPARDAFGNTSNVAATVTETLVQWLTKLSATPSRCRTMYVPSLPTAFTKSSVSCHHTPQKLRLSCIEIEKTNAVNAMDTRKLTQKMQSIRENRRCKCSGHEKINSVNAEEMRKATLNIQRV